MLVTPFSAGGRILANPHSRFELEAVRHELNRPRCGARHPYRTRWAAIESAAGRQDVKAAEAEFWLAMDTSDVSIDQVIYGSFLLSSGDGGSCFRFEGVHSSDTRHEDAPADADGPGAGDHAAADAAPVGQGLGANGAAQASGGPPTAAGDAARPMAPLLVGPERCHRPADEDDFGLPQARDRAPAEELLRNPHATTNQPTNQTCPTASEL